MEKEINWSASSRKDLRRIYEFNTEVIGEEKAFELIEMLMEKADLLKSSKVNPGTRYKSKRHPERKYYKLIEGYHIIIYRQDTKVIYINRVFDTRQNPKKLKV